jgi:signal transduction histidine kinase
VVAGFLPILKQAAGPRIDVDLNVARPLVCLVDPIHLESALLNLVLNSKDAMPQGGRIAIEVREAEPPRGGRMRRVRKAAAVPWAQVVVRDEGAGMSRDVLERAFEPFFTTRTGGNGLGLSQVLGFVQQSAGEVRIESKEGAGTAVILLFPAAADPLAPHTVPST